MADDQNTKTMDINDLVRELSKSSTSARAPSITTDRQAPAPQPSKPLSNPMPPMPAPKPFIPPAPSTITPRPQFNTPPSSSSQPLTGQAKPPIPPLSSVPATTPGVKEYQSSIRTMNDDLSNLKQGQKPVGVDVPRKVEQVVPIVPQPIPPKPTLPVGGQSQQFKVPNVNLGEAQKTAPLAQSKNFSIPSKPVPSSVPVAPKIEPKSQIYVPQEGPKGGSRNMLFMGIGVLAIVAGLFYWFFALRTPAPVVVIETPTPTPTATPIQDLNSIFSGINTENVSVKDPAIDLNIATKTLAINGGEFKNLNVTSELKGQFSLGLLELLAKPTQQLIDNMGSDYKVLLYGQKEVFDSKGQLKINSVVEKRLVFVNEVKGAVLAVQLGKDWEVSMNEDLKPIFEFDPKKQESKDFGDNSYGGFAIRYKNFKYADRSVDYAVVSLLNGKSYLVIAGSREAMYATLDKLRGF